MSGDFFLKPLFCLGVLPVCFLSLVPCACVLLSSCEQEHSVGSKVPNATEILLEVQPARNEEGEPIPLSAQDVEMVCRVMHKRLQASSIRDAEISHEGNRICVCIPRQGADSVLRGKGSKDLERILTEMVRLELLAVHPDSEQVIAEEEVQHAIRDYEERTEAYEQAVQEGNAPLSRPALPHLPAELNLGDYMILPYPHSGDKADVEYIVVRKPAAAGKDGVYMTDKEVFDACGDPFFKDRVSVTLNSEGAARMSRLTGSMTLGRDRLAVVLNSRVRFAPIVQSVLDKEFMISGLDDEAEVEDLLRALNLPLSYDVKVIECQEVPHHHR